MRVIFVTGLCCLGVLVVLGGETVTEDCPNVDTKIQLQQNTTTREEQDEEKHERVDSERFLEDEEEDPWETVLANGIECGAYSCLKRDFWAGLHCDQLESPRPIHDESTWRLLRAVYYGIVGPHLASIDSPFDCADRSLANNNTSSGFRVPFQVKQCPEEGKGRGVFATQDISKGSLVWTANANRAEFPDASYFRRFLLTIPKDLACDVLQWSYPIYLNQEDEDDAVICTDLDEGSFMNQAHDSSMNTGCLQDVAEGYPGHCRDNFFAVRDISAGEEILTRYGGFASTEIWTDMGFEDDDYGEDEKEEEGVDDEDEDEDWGTEEDEIEAEDE